MCTAITFVSGDCYFGRNLDYEHSFGEEIVIMPRRFRLDFGEAGTLENHYAAIGVARAAEGYPLFFDAVNECGLAAAGLNFSGNAFLHAGLPERTNIAQFEFIPWVLSRCADIFEAKTLTDGTCITPTPFSEKMPASELHWIFADKNGAITVESVREGIKVYENKAGVLTNNPPFDMQMFNLNNYMGVSNGTVGNTFAPKLELDVYSRGMGGMGLPGDLSSQSRFVRAAWAAANSVCDGSDISKVGQLFHLLEFEAQPRGCCEVRKGEYEFTRYSSVCNADKGVCYVSTYENRRLSAVNMHSENLDGSELIRFPIPTDQDIRWLND